MPAEWQACPEAEVFQGGPVWRGQTYWDIKGLGRADCQVGRNCRTGGQDTALRRQARKHWREARAVGRQLYILRQVQATITLPGNKKPRQWTGHSFLVGAAVDPVESGYTIEQVMRKGDWKSAQAGLQ